MKKSMKDEIKGKFHEVKGKVKEKAGVRDPGTLLCKSVIAAKKSCGGPSRESETILALVRKQMAHDHGNEYQVRIIQADGTERVDEWRRAACSGDGWDPQGTRQSLLASGTKRSLSRLLRQGTDNNIGMSHYGYPVSTIPPPRFPLSGGSGVEEPVRIA
jgi:hypothetical protein